MNARSLQVVRKNYSERTREERPGRFLTRRSTIELHVKMFKQLRASPAHVEERASSKQVTQEGDVEGYGGLKFQIDETIFAAYRKAEMRKAKILMIASWDLLNTFKSLFWPDMIMLAETDLDWMQSISMAIGVQQRS